MRLLFDDWKKKFKKAYKNPAAVSHGGWPVSLAGGQPQNCCWPRGWACLPLPALAFAYLPPQQIATLLHSCCRHPSGPPPQPAVLVASPCHAGQGRLCQVPGQREGHRRRQPAQPQVLPGTQPVQVWSAGVRVCKGAWRTQFVCVCVCVCACVCVEMCVWGQLEERGARHADRPPAWQQLPASDRRSPRRRLCPRSDLSWADKRSKILIKVDKKRMQGIIKKWVVWVQQACYPRAPAPLDRHQWPAGGPCCAPPGRSCSW